MVATEHSFLTRCLKYDIILTGWYAHMKRTDINSQTRTNLLDAAMALMLQKGFTATSVDEICKAAGVTKGSFFYYFTNKDALGQAVLGHFQQKMGDMLEQGPHLTMADPLQRLYAYCDYLALMLAHPQVPKSCLLGNFAQELAPTNPEIAAICQAGFALWTGAIQADLEAARTQYPPPIDFDSHTMAEHFIAIFEGALILAKAQQDIAVVRTHLEHFKHYLALLFGIPQAVSI